MSRVKIDINCFTTQILFLFIITSLFLPNSLFKLLHATSQNIRIRTVSAVESSNIAQDIEVSESLHAYIFYFTTFSFRFLFNLFGIRLKQQRLYGCHSEK
jgi:hypothetical protein